MQAFNFWRKFNLYRREIIFAGVFFLFCSSDLLAQRRTGVNNPEYDNKMVSYGFLIGLHTTAYQLKYSDEFVTNSLDSIYAITPKWSPGFSLGFIVNMRLTDLVDFRVLPKVAFYEHELVYERLDDSPIEELVETTIVEFPMLIKYKSARRGNVRMYLTGGIKPGIEASGKNDIERASDDNLKIREFNVSMDVGFGLDIYYPLFKFSPELRFSKGIRNMLGPQGNDFSAGIDRLNTNTITLYLLFQ